MRESKLQYTYIQANNTIKYYLIKQRMTLSVSHMPPQLVSFPIKVFCRVRDERYFKALSRNAELCCCR